jgi:hypothetical protein
MKKIAFYFLHAVIVTIGLFVAWTVGGLVGAAIAEMPPPDADPAQLASRFLLVTIINAMLITILTAATNTYRGFYRWLFLVLFVFGIQFFLTQMETVFFLDAIGMTGAQVAAVLVTGLTMALLTVSASLAAERIYIRKASQKPYTPRLETKGMLRPVLILALVVYPLLYFVFGYFIAWQNPDLREFYTGSSELRTFSAQLSGFIVEGIYPFQILRAFLWVLLTLPLIAMMGVTPGQIVLFALLNALIPASMLLLPNSFMPASVATSHLYETASSNFVWGIVLALLLAKSRPLLNS